MPITITTNQFKFKDPTTGQYRAISAVADESLEDRLAEISAAGAEAIADVTSTKNAALQAVEAKEASAVANVADAAEVQDMVAEVFDVTKNYNAGDYVIYETSGVSKLYRFTVAHAAGAWVGTDATAVVIGQDVKELKSAMYRRTFTSSDIASGFITSNGNVSPSDVWDCTNFVYIPDTETIKIKSTLYGNGGIAFYDGDKFCLLGINGNNASTYGYSANSKPVERVYEVPDGTTYVRFCVYIGDTATYADMYMYGIGMNAVVESMSKMNTSIAKNDILIDNFTENIVPELEIGSIDILDSGWNYYANTKRVRTPQDYTIRLTKGDTIKLTDYSAARFYVGWLKENGTYGARGWLRDDFVATEPGDYVILITAVPEATVSDVSDLGNLLRVTHYMGQTDFVDVDEFGNGISRNNGYSHYNVKSVNHRGFNSVAPENTLPAFKLSSKMGFQYVETDVRMTNDGEIVCLHDTSINRTARNADGSTISATVNIADITLAQALTYDFGIWKGSEYAGTKIPTFEEFMALCKALGLHPYIELEFSTTIYIEKCVSVVKKYGMKDCVTWISGVPDTLIALSETLPKARLGYVVNTINSTAISNVPRFKTGTNDVFIDANTANLTDTEVSMCIDADIPLEVWTTNSESYITTMNPYISGVTSDSIIANRLLYDNAMD